MTGKHRKQRKLAIQNLDGWLAKTVTAGAFAAGLSLAGVGMAQAEDGDSPAPPAVEQPAPEASAPAESAPADTPAPSAEPAPADTPADGPVGSLVTEEPAPQPSEPAPSPEPDVEGAPTQDIPKNSPTGTPAPEQPEGPQPTETPAPADQPGPEQIAPDQPAPDQPLPSDPTTPADENQAALQPTLTAGDDPEATPSPSQPTTSAPPNRNQSDSDKQQPSGWQPRGDAAPTTVGPVLEPQDPLSYDDLYLTKPEMPTAEPDLVDGMGAEFKEGYVKARFFGDNPVEAALSASEDAAWWAGVGRHMDLSTPANRIANSANQGMAMVLDPRRGKGLIGGPVEAGKQAVWEVVGPSLRPLYKDGPASSTPESNDSGKTKEAVNNLLKAPLVGVDIKEMPTTSQPGSNKLDGSALSSELPFINQNDYYKAMSGPNVAPYDRMPHPGESANTSDKDLPGMFGRIAGVNPATMAPQNGGGESQPGHQ